MFNQDLFFLIYNLRGVPFWDNLMIFGAKEAIFLEFILSIILAIKWRTERRALVLFLVAAPITLLAIKLIHLIYFEPRPFMHLVNIQPLIDHTIDASFPSVHTSVAFALAFSYFLIKSRFFWIFLILALWIGFARIYVGVHYPLDILGGIVLGFITAFFPLLLKRKLVQPKKPEKHKYP